MATKSQHGSVDTNLLLRVVLHDVPAHAKAIETLLKKGGSYYVEDVAIIEMVFVLEKLYSMTRDVVVDNVLVIINHKQLMCTNRIFEIALPLYLTQSSLSFMDCMLLVYARSSGHTPLFTFDKALAKHSDGDALRVL